MTTETITHLFVFGLIAENFHSVDPLLPSPIDGFMNGDHLIDVVVQNRDIAVAQSRWRAIGTSHITRSKVFQGFANIILSTFQ